jgi:hypothetical protein
VEQPLSYSALEDTWARAQVEIMMIGSPWDICLITYSLPCSSSGCVAALELPWYRRWVLELS